MAGSPSMMTDVCGLHSSRTNVAVMRLNATISPNARYAKVFPHMTDDGNFPEEFSAAKTVGMMRNLDSTCATPLLPPTTHHLNLPSGHPAIRPSGHPFLPLPPLSASTSVINLLLSYIDSQLDRIMQAYRLEPIETLSSSWKLDISGQDRPTMSRDTPIGDARSRQAKLRAIWEFLGCYQLINQERQ